MRIAAFSLNETTSDFKAAIAALRYSGHVVDLYRKRSFYDSLHGYTAAIISLGDWTDDSALNVKLAAAKAACELPTCYFLDAPPFRSHVEDFWRSAIYGETAAAMQHRAELTKALKSDEWRPKIEAVVQKWACPDDLPAIRPWCDWDAGPFETPPDNSLSMPGSSAIKIDTLVAKLLRRKALTH